MDVSAPYNFVELSEHICKAADLGLECIPEQDTPLDIALSGSIKVTLNCDTPLLVSWAPTGADGIKQFGSIPNETPAIPGASWRGMIRNVMEIAFFGRMALVDGDARTSVRDLHYTARLDYGNRMSGSCRNGFEPKTFAGWLQMKEGKLTLTPCAFARIDHKDIDTLGNGFKENIQQAYKRYTKAKAPRCLHDDVSSAENVERIFTGGGGTLSQKLWVQKQIHKHRHNGKNLNYRRAAKTKEAAERSGGASQNRSAKIKDGTLVFTGRPSHQKHMEFFFFDPSDTAHEVADAVWARFIDVHEKQEKESPTWVWRRKALYAGEAIPVFYLSDAQGTLQQIGMAMMFKLGGDNTIGEMIDHTNSGHRNPAEMDLPTRLFGRLETKKGQGDGFRTRLSFGWLKAKEGTWDAPKDQDVKIILAKPKPGFVPSYIRQRDFKQSHPQLTHNAQYRSYMNWPDIDPNKEHIRGWKRYPVHPAPVPATTDPAPEGDSVSCLRPLRPREANRPMQFTGRLCYHNLHPLELGALLWTLTWGGDRDLRHSLGMGKPLGWGQVRLSLAQNALDSETIDALRVHCIVSLMEDWAKDQGISGGWAHSLQLCQLKAMANPEIGKQNGKMLRQMTLAPGVNNEFDKVRKDGHILPDYPVGKGCVLPAYPVPQHVKKLDKGPNQPHWPKPLTSASPRAEWAEEVGSDSTAPPEASTETSPRNVRFPKGARALHNGGLYVVVAIVGQDKQNRKIRLVADPPDGVTKNIKVWALKHPPEETPQ